MKHVLAVAVVFLAAAVAWASITLPPGDYTFASDDVPPVTFFLNVDWAGTLTDETPGHGSAEYEFANGCYQGSGANYRTKFTFSDIWTGTAEVWPPAPALGPPITYTLHVGY